MFLTKMPINAARRGARRLLASPQRLHSAVLHGFAPGAANGDGRVLWRLDTYERHRVLLYVASPDKPDFTHVVEQAGWPTTETWETKSYQPLLESLKPGQRWQFRLTANPVRSGRREGWADTKPLGHVTVSQQEQWLLDRVGQLGFRVLPSNVVVTEDGTAEPDLAVVDRSIRRFDRNGAQVTVSMATYQGRLEVTDADLLRRALTRGVGRAKAYGCGLLTLARPPARASS